MYLTQNPRVIKILDENNQANHDEVNVICLRDLRKHRRPNRVKNNKIVSIKINLDWVNKEFSKTKNVLFKVG